MWIEDAVATGVLAYFQKKLRLNKEEQRRWIIACAKNFMVDLWREKQYSNRCREFLAAREAYRVAKRWKRKNYSVFLDKGDIIELRASGVTFPEIARIKRITTEAAKKRFWTAIKKLNPGDFDYEDFDETPRPIAKNKRRL